MGEVVPPTAPRIDKAPIRIIDIFISTARETAKITIIDWTDIAPGPAAERR